MGNQNLTLPFQSIENEGCEKSRKQVKFYTNDKKGAIQLSSKDLDRHLSHTIGNTLNELIFGMTYEESDKTWNRIQYLREEGIKVHILVQFSDLSINCFV